MKFCYKGINGTKKGDFWCFEIGLVRHEVRYLARCWEIIDEVRYLARCWEIIDEEVR